MRRGFPVLKPVVHAPKNALSVARPIVTARVANKPIQPRSFTAFFRVDEASARQQIFSAGSKVCGFAPNGR